MRHSLIAAAVLAAAFPFASHAIGPEPAEPAATHFHVGKLDVASLSDSNYVIPNDGKIFGADVGPDAVAALLRSAKLPPDVVTLPVDALLVRDRAHVALIDTGLGPQVGGVLLASLKRAGVEPSQVTDVLITHVHPDHIGGLVDASGRSAFPDAKIHISAADWASLQAQPDKSALVQAITAQVVPFAPGAAITPSITSVAIKGHTDGHVGYRIVSGKQRLLDVGDAVHSSIVSLQKPEWTMGFDQDAKTAKDSRAALLAQVARTHETIFAPHFPYPGVGQVVGTASAYAWKPFSP